MTEPHPYDALALYVYEITPSEIIRRPYTHSVLVEKGHDMAAEIDFRKIYLNSSCRWSSYRLVKISHWDNGSWKGRVVKGRVVKHS